MRALSPEYSVTFETDNELSGEQKLWLAVIERRLLDYAALLSGNLSLVFPWKNQDEAPRRRKYLRDLERFIQFELFEICEDCGFSYDAIRGYFLRLSDSKGESAVLRKIRGRVCFGRRA